MQKTALRQIQQTKLSPQQLQYIKLLQVSGSALQHYIEEELAINPLLEQEEPQKDATELQETLSEGRSYSARLRAGYTRAPALEDHRIPPATDSAQEQLQKQIQFLALDADETTIAEYLIGELDADGYLRTPLDVLCEDLALTYYVEVTPDQLVQILHKLQQLDPPGLFARNLQECLLLQLQRHPKHHTAAVQQAIQTVTHCFEALGKRNYESIVAQLNVDRMEALRPALTCISQLDPRPGRHYALAAPIPSLQPDFVVTQRHGSLEVRLQRESTPKLRINKQYHTLLRAGNQSETTDFVRKKLNQAQWFLHAIQQRQVTLQRTMDAICTIQLAFFTSGDAMQLRPMTLKQVAQRVGRDISTISRSIRHKVVQTDFGTFPLKYFFSEAVVTLSGKTISSAALKAALQTLIEQENKAHPYTDDQIVIALQQKGYKLARRTVAKYRHKLHIPVAKLRRQA